MFLYCPMSGSDCLAQKLNPPIPPSPKSLLSLTTWAFLRGVHKLREVFWMGVFYFLIISTIRYYKNMKYIICLSINNKYNYETTNPNI